MPSSPDQKSGLPAPRQESDALAVALGEHPIPVVVVTLAAAVAQHPAELALFWLGDAVGNYEDDTLGIDTVGVKTDRLHAVRSLYSRREGFAGYSRRHYAVFC
jgi:hypothetical protein